MSSLADAIPVCIHLNIHEEAKVGNKQDRIGMEMRKVWEQDRIGMGMRKVGRGTRQDRYGNKL